MLLTLASWTVVDILKQFPAIWATLGLLVGGCVMFLVAKKLGPMRLEAMNEVVAAYKEQVSAQVALAEVNTKAHTAALEMQQAHWAEELRKVEVSRDEYKGTLHTVRNDLGKEITDLKLENQELKLRPNVEILQTEQQKFYRQLSETLQSISTGLTEHDAKIDQRLDKHLNPMRQAIVNLARSLRKKKKPVKKVVARKVA